MRFALVTLGSAGDLYPFLALGRALRRRGHRVWLLTQAPYEGLVRAEGLEFLSIAPLAAHRRTVEHPLLWHPLHGFGVLWRHLAVPAIPRTVESLSQLTERHGAQGPLTVLASPLAVGARFARDRWPTSLRLLSIYTAPMGLRSLEDPLFVGPYQCPAWTPRWMRSMLWAALDRFKLEPMARRTLEAFQHRWATPALTSSIFGEWIHSPDGGMALYPSWFAKVPAAWRSRGVVQADDFPMFEPRPARVLPVPVTEFCQVHPRYAVVYPGSAGGNSHDFVQRLLPAFERMGIAVLALLPQLGSQTAPSLRTALPTLTACDIPLGPVLANATVFVHHGGIGSVAQGLRARVPQLILASAYDQFENGARVEALGAGHWHPLRRASPSRIGRSLRQLSLAGRTSASVLDDSARSDTDPEYSLEQLAQYLERPA